MAWSTRELAELAGTTLQAVWHYHEVGLMEEPDRLADGQEQYGVPHLLRVLQIERLVDLGVPLAQVATAGRDEPDPDEALRLLDADLAARIARLQRVLADLPASLDAVGDDVPDVDRTMLLVYARVLDDPGTAHLRQGRAQAPRAASDEFEQLPSDADEVTRGRLAGAIAAATREQLRDHLRLGDVEGHASHRLDIGGSPVLAALRQLYNPAQVDVLRRAYDLTWTDPDRPGP